MSLRRIYTFLVAILIGGVGGIVVAGAQFGLAHGDEGAILTGVVLMWLLCCVALLAARWLAKASA